MRTLPKGNHGNQEIKEDFKNKKTLCLIILIPNLGILKHPGNHGLHQTFKTHGEDTLMGICHFINIIILCILNFLNNTLNQILSHHQFPKSSNHSLYLMLKGEKSLKRHSTETVDMDEDLVTKKSRMPIKNQDVVDIDDDDERSINKGKATIVEEESHDLSQSVSNTERTITNPTIVKRTQDPTLVF